MAEPALYFRDEAAGLTLYHGDCRVILPELEPGSVDLTLAGPPYGATALRWDRVVRGWPALARPLLRAHGSLWCFSSLRHLLASAPDFAGWRLAQEVIWHKHNGSNFHVDRFRRVHELVAHFYPGDTPWRAVYKAPQYSRDATRRTVRRKGRPAHTGRIAARPYRSTEGGPRLLRSVIAARSCHGKAFHPTEKPLAVLAPLLAYSCPLGGVVLDPFAGGGATLLACRRLGLACVAIERDKGYCRAIVERLRQPMLPGLSVASPLPAAQLALPRWGDG